MDDHIKLLTLALGDNRVKENVDITEHLATSLGGMVRAFYLATTTKELIKAVETCRELKLDLIIIGSGSKVTLEDQGFSGVVIKNRSDNLRIFGIKGKVTPRVGLGIEEAFLEADSGVSLNTLADFSLKQGLAGLETLKTVPGTLGGSLSINHTVREKVYQVKVLDEQGETIQKQLLEVLQGDIILSVTFKLKSRKT